MVPKQTLESLYSGLRCMSNTVRASILSEADQKDCKYEMYKLKCWLEDEYKKLPVFVGEEQWEQDRLMNILKD